jgi:plasmid stability protein
MKRTTIFIDEGIERELRLVARRRGRSVAAVVRDAIAREVATETRPTLSFIGVGDSGRRDIAERHEELLWKGLEPHPLEAPGKPSAARPPSRSRRRATGKTRR